MAKRFMSRQEKDAALARKRPRTEARKQARRDDQQARESANKACRAMEVPTEWERAQSLRRERRARAA